MRKLYPILMLLLLYGGRIYGQQENQYTQFMYNKLQLNPGVAGSRGMASASALYRNQWIGFEGHPQSQLISIDGPFLAKRSGVGLTLGHQEAGLIKSTTVSLAYSYDLISTEATSLWLGLQGSVRNYRLDFNDPSVNIREPGDNSIYGAGKTNTTYGNVGFGMYFMHRDFYLGLSVPYFLKNAIGYNKSSLSTVLTATEQQHVYAMGGGMFSIGGRDDLHLKPSFLIKYVVNAPISVDGNLSLMFNRRFAIGASYRMGVGIGSESVDATVFYQISPRLGMGAAYDMTISKLRGYNAGSMELLLRYDFLNNAKNKLGKDDYMTNPRFFF